MTRAWLLAAGAALVAGTVVLSGVISIKASSGHLAVTSWVLDLAKRRTSKPAAARATALPDCRHRSPCGE
jgi:hypothetical protein